MENEDTEYKEGGSDEFIKFIFSNKPKGKNTVKLELGPCEKDIKIGLHIFQELLMIFTEGSKYLFGKEDKVDITKLCKEDIELLNEYFESFGFTLHIDIFTIIEYIDNMKMPNYFLHQELIKDDTLLKDIYYETSFDGNIYRIYFDFLK
tara:strand:- start:12 stop:458 length:447 start_codon:yes stop_codon:yes gene_type:complete